jgi:predicted ATPase/class 3 adenylate cyclase
MAAQPTGTVTLLFTDIEGSTALLQRFGTDRYAEALELHRTLLREAFERHDAYEVDCEGDAFFVAFSTAEDAVEAAAEAQQALAVAEWEDGNEMRVRMGIHTGAPLAVPPKYVGLDVHRAARIMAAGHGGQVLLSQTTRDLVGETAPVRDLGEHRLKDLSSGQRLYQLVIDQGAADFPALKTLENRPTNLPVQPTALIGRENELAEVEALLGREQVRLVTLTGTGGTGKTRLALQAAAALVEEFPSGVFLVSLAPVRDPELVVATVAQALGVREQPGEPLERTLQAYLRDRKLLLLLDNFEQLTQAATAVSSLLAAAPQVKLLVTSRTPLHLSGEQVYEVPPLGLPDSALAMSVEALTQYESVALFIERAIAAKSGFATTNENAPAIAEICVRLDGLPLALELAAARVRVLSPQALLARLDERMKLLTGGAQDLDERQRTLRATIDWSYDLLSEQEKGLFVRLSVFAGGCRVEAAEAVVDPQGEGETETDLLDGLSSLVDKSLLRQREDPDGEPRFWMLETIREYATQTLRTSPHASALSERHARYFLAFAEQAAPELEGPAQRFWVHGSLLTIQTFVPHWQNCWTAIPRLRFGSRRRWRSTGTGAACGAKGATHSQRLSRAGGRRSNMRAPSWLMAGSLSHLAIWKMRLRLRALASLPGKAWPMNRFGRDRCCCAHGSPTSTTKTRKPSRMLRRCFRLPTSSGRALQACMR